MTVVAFPDCDMHKMGTVELIPAAYDGKTFLGPWAYMCEECFTDYGVGLGVGRGQRLVLRPKTLEDLGLTMEDIEGPPD